MAKILVLHGPNLNLLGEREPARYGSTRLDEINHRLHALAQAAGHELEAFQSNAEHVLVEKIHAARATALPVAASAADGRADFILINPAAFTHTSVALRDALLAVNIPFIEIHLSNIYAREPFRQHSYFSDIAKGVISGLGARGYELALQAAIALLEPQV